uniref:Uncharacterized protein n=1 Tax=Chrysotila carterae TaxID=13221 RepID=A0A7S4BEG8_CHRCT|mmetsp:Transcript_15206/g.32492  ORF Transcript_15206/g.32492 Transcript_15206/m.32492 type:complete len:254 (+) Transcript_15206:47-808(+)
MASPPPTLVVWDFDWSLVNENSDTFVIHQLDPSGKIWAEARKLRKEQGVQWTQLMDWAVGALQDAGHSVEAMRTAQSRIPVLRGALEAVRLSAAAGAEQRVLSDANELYINWILEAIGIAPSFSAVETNGASVDATGRLRVSPHQPTTQPHGCPLCPANLCKGAVIERWLASFETRPRVIYVGDGGGDFCAVTKLAADDVLLARQAPHDRLLAKVKQPPEGYAVAAKVFEWSEADDGAALAAGFAAALPKPQP